MGAKKSFKMREKTRMWLRIICEIVCGEFARVDAESRENGENKGE
jgi:hypothetical protein